MALTHRDENLNFVPDVNVINIGTAVNSKKLISASIFCSKQS